ncbi:two-component system response regulator (stage 0 sporulation protein F) [Geothermobacter ehrlichii]|uniref:Two-component system response regulator (Stage 0 sporulation protein F) n=1 Tax=Geothermobacter ehrlichii TaxID=213224 RepID=A0A5D3WK41_9BACT|nr:response regulator [Geothermobacter ehrlichii]TYO99332.1 two-component system response regulator (stage 0 sporulation protein F) [Geothermobacter ehrlichii]
MYAANKPSEPHILLAEDDPAMRDLLAFCLYQAGYRVTSCGDGLSLLERLETNAEIDLVITDVRMPAMTGLEVLEATLDSKRRPPTICMTAFGDESTHEQARRLGAVKILDKPFDIEALVETVRQYCPPRRPASVH